MLGYCNCGSKHSEEIRTPSSLLCYCIGHGKNNKPRMSEEEFNLRVNGFAIQAPFWKRGDETERTKMTMDVVACGGEGLEGGSVQSVSGEHNNLMEFAEQRALGRTPPGGRSTRKRMGFVKKKDIANDDAVQCDDATGNRLTEAVGSSPYLRMEGKGNDTSMNPTNIKFTTTTTTMAITTRLSYMERSELSAILDNEGGWAATFYRSRISKLTPPPSSGWGNMPYTFRRVWRF